MSARCADSFHDICCNSVFSFRRSEERRRTTYGTHQTAFRSAFIMFNLRHG